MDKTKNQNNFKYANESIEIVKQQTIQGKFLVKRLPKLSSQLNDYSPTFPQH